MMTNSLYDTMKWVTTILLPALGTLYFAVAQIWGLPAAEQVVGTITAVVTFLGVVLGLSTRAYNNSDERFDGELDIYERDETTDVWQFNVHDDPENLRNYDEVRLKVQTKDERTEQYVPKYADDDSQESHGL